MTDAEYLDALTDLRTRRSETIRIASDMMEKVWALRHLPITAEETWFLGAIKAVTDNLLKPS